MATAFEEEQEQVEERAHGPSPVEIANNSPAQIAKPLYRRPAVLVVGAVVVLIALVLGIRYWLYARSHESTDDAFIEGHIIQISPKVSGYVARVYVRSNQEVKAAIYSSNSMRVIIRSSFSRHEQRSRPRERRRTKHERTSVSRERRRPQTSSRPGRQFVRRKQEPRHRAQVLAVRKAKRIKRARLCWLHRRTSHRQTRR
jgi:hypothetical protein